MPSERFLKLDEDKQTRILKAAYEEFSRVPFEEVSINRIIQAADISRGSFYTYFEDKRDIMRCVFAHEQMKAVAEFQRFVSENGGDIWKGALAWCEFIIRNTGTEEMKKSLAIIVRNKIDFQMGEMCACTETHQVHIRQLIQWLKENAGSASCLAQMDEQTIEALLQLLVTSVMTAVAQVLSTKANEAESLRMLRVKLDILKSGAAGLATQGEGAMEQG